MDEPALASENTPAHTPTRGESTPEALSFICEPANALYKQYGQLVRRTIQLGSRAAQSGDVPVGALVCDGTGKVIGEGFNVRERLADPAGHAEIVALRAAATQVGTWNLSGCTLVVNLEPCTMCAGAIVNARVARVVFGAWDNKAGAAGSVRDVLRDQRLPHQVEVIGGVLENECAARLREWFEQLRDIEHR